ncbi:MAG: glycosyl hydrolase family 65 protein [Actinocatenispora sp.]
MDLLQRCFAGVETHGDALHLNPCWPSALGTLDLPLRYRQHDLTVSVRDRTIRVSSPPGHHARIRVVCHGTAASLGPAETVNFGFDVGSGSRPAVFDRGDGVS